MMLRLLGSILLGVGVLIAGASGLCSGVFLISGLQSGGGLGSLSDTLGIVLLVGGIPFAIGMALVWAGRALLRQADADDQR